MKKDLVSEARGNQSMAIREEMRRSQEIFNQVIELPESKRKAFLEDNCGSNRDLLNEVQKLVAIHFSAAEKFLESSPVLESTRGFPGQNIEQKRKREFRIPHAENAFEPRCIDDPPGQRPQRVGATALYRGLPLLRRPGVAELSRDPARHMT